MKKGELAKLGETTISYLRYMMAEGMLPAETAVKLLDVLLKQQNAPQQCDEPVEDIAEVPSHDILLPVYNSAPIEVLSEFVRDEN